MKMVDKKDWNEFRKTGLFMFINSILHVFGWAIIVEIDDTTGCILNAYPARVKFRGFSEEDTGEMHEKIAKYLNVVSEDLVKETKI